MEYNPDHWIYKRENGPLLVLGIEVDSIESPKPSFKEPEKWQLIRHQTAGYACHQRILWGQVLQPKPEVHVAMCELEKQFLNSCMGLYWTILDDVMEYRKALSEKLYVDCNVSFIELEEAYYPIDCDEWSLSKLTEQTFPDDLDDLIEWPDTFSRLTGCLGRWDLVILGENCD